MIQGYVLAFLITFTMGFMLVFTGCKKDSDPNPEPTQSVTKIFTSTSTGGVLTLEGTSLVIESGTVPRLANGDPATVNFSVEVNVTLPKALPSNMKLVGKTSHFGPEGFIMSEPMLLQFTLPDGVALDQASIVGYDNASGNYGVYPITYYDPDNKVVGTVVYELGYYMLANVNELNRTRAPFGAGGFQINQFQNRDWYPQAPANWQGQMTYHRLIITNFVPAFPQEMAYWAPYDPNSNGGQRYWEVWTPSVAGGGSPNHTIGMTFRGPQGTYTAQLIAYRRVSQNSPQECKQYSLPMTFTIGSPITCTSANICSGWSPAPAWPTGAGQWNDIDCYNYKPLPTIPVCTGDFQATLTWFNGSGSFGDTDLDLHLYGPNGMHVYWVNKNPGCPCGLMLDRDMIDETGWVQENICANSIAAMPRGEYRLEVELFSGKDKEFQVRLIRGTQSQTFNGNVTQSNPSKRIITFTL